MSSTRARFPLGSAIRCFAFALTFVTWAGLSGCESTPSSSNSGSNSNAPGWVALERTAGTLREAPAYVVTLYQDGGVLFEGRANVRSKGAFTKHIPPERAAVVFKQLDAIEFWNRQSRYDEERENRATGESIILRTASPDVPWDIISARSHNRFKRIDGLFFAPPELIGLKTLIEQTVDLTAWVSGTGGEAHE